MSTVWRSILQRLPQPGSSSRLLGKIASRAPRAFPRWLGFPVGGARPRAQGRFGVSGPDPETLRIGLSGVREVVSTSCWLMKGVFLTSATLFVLQEYVCMLSQTTGGSMEPTIDGSACGTLVLVNTNYGAKIPRALRPSYWWHVLWSGSLFDPSKSSRDHQARGKQPWTNMRRGDVILFWKKSGEYMVCKRIVGLPGDEIEYLPDLDPITEHDGVRSEDDEHVGVRSVSGITEQLTDGQAEQLTRTRVPSGNLWVEGDCPDKSVDSRRYGPVPQNLVLGKVFCILWPLFPRPMSHEPRETNSRVVRSRSP